MRNIKNNYSFVAMLFISLVTFAQSYKVNNYYDELGGYVIGLDSTGEHGLVISSQNLGITTRFTANDFIADESKYDEGSVKFKDWRLPTQDEFTVIRNNYKDNIYSKENKPNLKSGYYWTFIKNDEDSSDYFKIASMGIKTTRTRTLKALVHVVRTF